MKTLKKGEEIVRKRDEEAIELVKNGWVYCKKAEWKKVRDKNKSVSSEVVVEVKKSKDKVSKIDKIDKGPESDGHAKYKAKKAKQRGKAD